MGSDLIPSTRRHHNVSDRLAKMRRCSTRCERFTLAHLEFQGPTSAEPDQSHRIITGQAICFPVCRAGILQRLVRNRPFRQKPGS